MKYIFAISILLFPLFFYSCKESNIKRIGQLNKNIVHLDPRNSTYDNEGLSFSIEPIPLQTNSRSMFGDIAKIDMDSENIIIFDHFKTKAIYIFKRTGEFARTISMHGKGPGELQNPVDFTVGWTEKEIDVFDNATQSISRFDIFGSFKKNYFVGFPIEAFARIDASNYILYIGNFEGIYLNSRSLNNNLLLFNIQNGVGKELDPIVNKGPFYESCHVTLYLNDNHEIVYNNAGNANVYSIKDQKMGLKWILDFDKTFVPQRLIDESKTNFVYFFNSVLFNTDYVLNICGIWETTEYLVVSYLKNKRIFHCFIDKKDNRLVYKSDRELIIRNLTGVSNGRILNANSVGLMAIIDASDLLMAIDKHEINKSFYRKYQDQLDRVKETDNPIILLITINPK